MAETIVGTIAYDVKLNLDTLKSDAKAAEKIAKDSADRINKAQSKGSSGSSSSYSNSNSGANAAGESVAKSIEDTKKAAQASFESLSQYTPQIQGQFLAVERANMRVETATARATNAVTKYGSDSVQAISATNSLSGAVLNQSRAQQTLSNSLTQSTAKVEGQNSSFNSFASGGLQALTAGIIAATAVIAVNVGNAVTRFDTLNNAPKVLQNLGNSAEESKNAVAILDQGIRGLPTSLDHAVSSLTAIAGATDMSATSSATLALAFNNMALAGGKGAEEAQRAFVQFTQSLGRGKIGMQEFNTLSEVMPAQLSQIAKSLLGAGANTSTLRDAMSNGKVTMAEFSAEIIKLNSEGGAGFASFEQQAKDATAGISTGWANLNTAVTRGITDILQAIGGPEINSALSSIGSAFENGFKFISQTIEATKNGFAPLAAALAPTISMVQNLIAAISPFAIILAPAATSILVFATSIGALAVGTVVATKAMKLFEGTLTLITKHPIIATLSLITSLITGFATASGLGSLTDGLDKSADSSVDINQAMKDAMSHIGGAADNSKDLAKQLNKIDDQMQDVRDNFKEQLAELVQSKQKSIKELNSQLADERAAYDKSYTDRLADFNESQQEELQTHQSKVARLTGQIDFLKKYQNSANAQQLSSLQFQLAREDSLYSAQSAEQQSKYDQDAAAAKASYDKRALELQTQLDGETALLDKHRADVASIQGLILADEIDKLKQSRDEQLKSLEQQRVDAVTNNGTTGSLAGTAFGDGMNAAMKAATSKIDLSAQGSAAWDTFWNGFTSNVAPKLSDWIKNQLPALGVIGEMIASMITGDWDPFWDLVSKNIDKSKQKSISLTLAGNGGGRGWATGGFTGKGGVNEPAGMVHRGEYVLPQSMVNQSTGLPKLDTMTANQTASQPSIYVTVNASADMIRTASDKREFAKMIVDAYNQGRRAKALPELGAI